MAEGIIVTTSDTIQGVEIVSYLGIVRGLVVRIPTFQQGFEALGNALSGNWQAGAEMMAEVCETTRREAHSKMIEHAIEMGADAIVGMRYETSSVSDNSAEILAYGTAVKLKLPEATAAT